jgi:AraC family transcriptional regulator
MVCRSNFHQLIYFLNRFRGTIATDQGRERPCVLPSGTFAFFPAGVTSQWYLTSGRAIQILQRPDTYTNLAFDILQEGRGALVPKYGLCDPRVSRIVLTIANDIEHHFLDRFMADALNITLAVQVSRLCCSAMTVAPASLNGLSHERLRRVYDYVEAHLNRHLTLTELASVSGLSTYHFSRSFKQRVGVGPQRYLIQRRLERAKTLIRHSNQPLALIAQETGFVDQSHLTSVFHRLIGVTPGRFRASVLSR